jgi:hypothetical protein
MIIIIIIIIIIIKSTQGQVVFMLRDLVIDLDLPGYFNYASVLDGMSQVF